MKSQIKLNPYLEGGKRYVFIVRGQFSKIEIKEAINKIILGPIKITSLNRKGFKQNYLTLKPAEELVLECYRDLILKELSNEVFDPALMEKNLEQFKNKLESKKLI